MQFTDEGYIINVRKHGETSLILTLITRAHGKLVGYVRGGHSKKNLGVYQPGNLIAVDAYARIEENMLSFRAELLKPTAVRFSAAAANCPRFPLSANWQMPACPKRQSWNAFTIWLTAFLIL